VRVIALRIVTHNNISAWHMYPKRNVIEIPLMMVVVPPFYRHSATHNRGEVSQELAKQLPCSHQYRLRRIDIMKYHREVLRDLLTDRHIYKAL